METLSTDQAVAFQAAVYEHKNVFLTGPGGTGKSYLIQTIHAALTVKPQVCAMTGTAAMLLNCKATTLHSWAGIGNGTGDLLTKVMRNFASKKKWREVRTLILDEVSMLTRELFEQLDLIARTVRKSPLPFGGIQVIFCGDFCQLPPISEEVAEVYCFQSPVWDRTFPCQIMLKTIHRQKEAQFCKILQQLREGKITRSTLELLNSRIVSGETLAALNAIRIVPTRGKADAMNNSEYEKLVGAEVVSTATLNDEFEMTALKVREREKTTEKLIEFEKENLLKRVVATLKLKLGCHVMCTYNIDESLCNGSQGEVVGFTGSARSIPVVKMFHDGCVRAIRPIAIESDRIPGLAVVQLPLIYSWAITVHKAQGATLAGAAVLDVGTGIFEAGQTYTALSRLTSFENVYLTSFDPSKIRTNPAVISFYDKLELRTEEPPTKKICSYF
jgi:ATP-dependent DNA helicase PIF1